MQHVSDSNILGHDPSWHGEACHRAPHCHNAIFYTLPHYLIAILPHPPTCYVRAVWKYGYGHFYTLARALIPAFPPSYNVQKYFTVKIHPQFSILHPLSCRRTFVAATHIQDPAGWKETHFPTTHILVVWYLNEKIVGGHNLRQGVDFLRPNTQQILGLLVSHLKSNTARSKFSPCLPL